MFEDVTIAYRGGTYEVGVGRMGYAIWIVGASRSRPLERWPETAEGWSAAMARFLELQPPGTFAPVGRRTNPFAGSLSRPAIHASAGVVAAAALLAAGVILGIAGLFPGYLGGASLAAQPADLTQHLIYLAAWAAGGALTLLGGGWLRAGALLTTGVSAVTFGLFFADAGTVIADGPHAAGAGLWLGLAGWLACAAGSVLAFRLGIRRTTRVTPAGAVPAGAVPAGAVPAGAVPAGAVPVGAPARAAGMVAMLTLGALGALGAAIAFVPAWDSFTLRTSAGTSQTVTAGYVFASPAPVIAGDIAAMVALVAVVVAAALQRPVRLGAALLAGALIPMVAQAVSALIQVGEATSPAEFGISSAQASAAGLTISNGLTLAFWIFCLCLVALTVSFAWMLNAPGPADAPAIGTAAAPSPVVPAPAVQDIRSPVEPPGTARQSGTGDLAVTPADGTRDTGD